MGLFIYEISAYGEWGYLFTRFLPMESGTVYLRDFCLSPICSPPPFPLPLLTFLINKKWFSDKVEEIRFSSEVEEDMTKCGIMSIKEDLEEKK